MSMVRWVMSWGIALVLALPAGAEEPDDPYLWLEDVTGEKPLAWVKEQNARSTAELTKQPEFARIQDRLLKILDSDERIPFVVKNGELYYNFWRDATHKRGLWRRTTLEEYRKPEPKWEIVLDLDALAEKEKENWVWGGDNMLRPSYGRCLINLSRGGADASVAREFDPIKKEFVKDGFILPEAKSNIGWKDQDTLFVSTDFGPGSLTKSGYPRIVKEWKRGTPLNEAKVVFEGKTEDISVGAYRTTRKGYEREFVNRQITFYTHELFHRKDGQLTKVEVPDDALTVSVVRDLLTVTLRTPWTVGGKSYPAGALIVADFDAFMKGERKFEMLFEPTERKKLNSFIQLRSGNAILNVLDNVRSRPYVLSRKDGKWERSEFPGAPKFGMVGATPVDADESDDYWMTVNDYLTPVTRSLGALGKGPPEKIKESPSFFDAKGLTVAQYEATSKDGTKIPYFQVSRADMKHDGTNPTLLYGYGGFQISLTPSYNPAVGAAWLEKGGVYAVANIRGGGEFGPQWHQAALKQNRMRAYEDFAAVADDLARRKVTSPKHLGIEGGSNGGLLMGNMLTLYPEKFGAIVCQVPLMDMQRYHKLLAGASWMAEYGNPDNPKEWDFIQTFSPYHTVKKGAKYPRVLFTTSTRDDRVHPGHARKMVAKMTEMGHNVLYYENVEGGHGGAADNKQRAYMSALAYTFLWQELK